MRVTQPRVRRPLRGFGAKGVTTTPGQSTAKRSGARSAPGTKHPTKVAARQPTDANEAPSAAIVVKSEEDLQNKVETKTKRRRNDLGISVGTSSTKPVGRSVTTTLASTRSTTQTGRTQDVKRVKPSETESNIGGRRFIAVASSRKGCTTSRPPGQGSGAMTAGSTVRGNKSAPRVCEGTLRSRSRGLTGASSATRSQRRIGGAMDSPVAKSAGATAAGGGGSSTPSRSAQPGRGRSGVADVTDDDMATTDGRGATAVGGADEQAGSDGNSAADDGDTSASSRSRNGGSSARVGPSSRRCGTLIASIRSAAADGESCRRILGTLLRVVLEEEKSLVTRKGGALALFAVVSYHHTSATICGLVTALLRIGSTEVPKYWTKITSKTGSKTIIVLFAGLCRTYLRLAPAVTPSDFPTEDFIFLLKGVAECARLDASCNVVARVHNVMESVSDLVTMAPTLLTALDFEAGRCIVPGPTSFGRAASKAERSAASSRERFRSEGDGTTPTRCAPFGGGALDASGLIESSGGLKFSISMGTPKRARKKVVKKKAKKAVKALSASGTTGKKATKGTGKGSGLRKTSGSGTALGAKGKKSKTSAAGKVSQSGSSAEAFVVNLIKCVDRLARSETNCTAFIRKGVVPKLVALCGASMAAEKKSVVVWKAYCTCLGTLIAGRQSAVVELLSLDAFLPGLVAISRSCVTSMAKDTATECEHDMLRSVMALLKAVGSVTVGRKMLVNFPDIHRVLLQCAQMGCGDALARTERRSTKSIVGDGAAGTGASVSSLLASTLGEDTLAAARACSLEDGIGARMASGDGGDAPAAIDELSQLATKLLFRLRGSTHLPLEGSSSGLTPFSMNPLLCRLDPRLHAFFEADDGSYAFAEEHDDTGVPAEDPVMFDGRRQTPVVSEADAELMRMIDEGTYMTGKSAVSKIVPLDYDVMCSVRALRVVESKRRGIAYSRVWAGNGGKGGEQCVTEDGIFLPSGVGGDGGSGVGDVLRSVSGDDQSRMSRMASDDDARLARRSSHDDSIHFEGAGGKGEDDMSSMLNSGISPAGEDHTHFVSAVDGGEQALCRTDEEGLGGVAQLSWIERGENDQTVYDLLCGRDEDTRSLLRNSPWHIPAGPRLRIAEESVYHVRKWVRSMQEEVETMVWLRNSPAVPLLDLSGNRAKVFREAFSMAMLQRLADPFLSLPEIVYDLGRGGPTAPVIPAWALRSVPIPGSDELDVAGRVASILAEISCSEQEASGGTGGSGKGTKSRKQRKGSKSVSGASGASAAAGGKVGASMVDDCMSTSLGSLMGGSSSQREALKERRRLAHMRIAASRTMPPLSFDSRFESGNLRWVARVGDTEYDLVTATDVNSPIHTQWFFFRVTNAVAGVPYRFNFVNFEKSTSQFNCGMRPVVYSRVGTATGSMAGWTRLGEQICYVSNQYMRSPGRQSVSSGARRVQWGDGMAPMKCSELGLSCAQPQGKQQEESGETCSTAGKGDDSSSTVEDHVVASEIDVKDGDVAAVEQGKDDAGTSSTALVATTGGSCDQDTLHDPVLPSDMFVWSEGASLSQRHLANVMQKRATSCTTLTIELTFPFNADQVYVAYHFPYTYSLLMQHLRQLEVLPHAKNTLRRELLCRSLGGNRCDLLTVTDFTAPRNVIMARRVIVLTGRVHPGESNASHMMWGMLRHITGRSAEAIRLRSNFVFKIIPMLNPDGVINGHHRCSLLGVDLNRVWDRPSPLRHPTIYYAKQLLYQLQSQCRTVELFCDFHGHSRRKNIFMFGCHPKHESYHARLFPLILNRVMPNSFSYEDSAFKVQKSKDSCGRVVAYQELGILRSYTMEASYCGASSSNMHYTPQDLEAIGPAFSLSLCKLLLGTDPQLVKELDDELAAAFPDDCGDEVSVLYEAPSLLRECDRVDNHLQQQQHQQVPSQLQQAQPVQSAQPAQQQQQQQQQQSQRAMKQAQPLVGDGAASGCVVGTAIGPLNASKSSSSAGSRRVALIELGAPGTVEGAPGGMTGSSGSITSAASQNVSRNLSRKSSASMSGSSAKVATVVDIGAAAFDGRRRGSSSDNK